MGEGGRGGVWAGDAMAEGVEVHAAELEERGRGRWRPLPADPPVPGVRRSAHCALRHKKNNLSPGRFEIGFEAQLGISFFSV